MMTNQEIWITILSGLLVNTVTGVVTYILTVKREKSAHERETERHNKQVAEIAINHLNTSYLASKRLRIDVLTHLRKVTGGNVEKEGFIFILDGISRSLEQNRISILSDMMNWKHYLGDDTTLAQEMERLRKEELSNVLMPPEPPTNPPVGPHFSQQGQDTLQRYARTKPAAGIDDLLAKPGSTPRERLERAVIANDIDSMRGILRERVASHAPVRQIVEAAGFLCLNGDNEGADAITDMWRNRRDELRGDDIRAMLGAITRFHECTDTEAEGLPLAEEMVNVLSSRKDVDDTDKGWAENQKGKLLYGTGDYRGALEATERAIRAAPGESAYYFNLSLIQEKLGDLEQAEKQIERCLALGTKNPSHYRHAVEMFVKRGKGLEALKAFQELQRFDDIQAKMVLMDSDIRLVLKEAQDAVKKASAQAPPSDDADKPTA